MKPKNDLRVVLFGLVSVFALVFLFLYPSGIVRGLSSTVQPLNKASYLLGETVTVPGSIWLTGENASSLDVNLVVDGPQSLTQKLPTTAGVFPYPSKNLKVTASLGQDTDNYGYGYGYGYSITGALNYQIQWTPPVFLDPPPVFKIIPDTQEAFPVPTPLPTATPEAGGPAELSSTTLAFNIPVIVTATPVAGAPADLPSSTEAFSVPSVPTPTPEPGVVDLPSATEAFAVPAIPTPVPDPNAPAKLPTVTLAFSVPIPPTPTPIPNVPELGDTAKAFDVPGGKIPEGIAHDGTNFYILVNGDTPEANDWVLKVDAQGTQIDAFQVPSRRAEDITYLSSYLYISNNEFWPPKIMKIDPADGSKKSDWDAPDTNNIRGITTDGTRLWMANEWGNQLYKVSTSGTILDRIYTGGWTNFNALALKENNLFTAQSDKVGAWDITTKQSITNWFTTLADIRGMTFKEGVLYIADADTQAIYKAQPPSLIEVTQEPEGMAYDGTNLYIVVNGTPKDKILVLNPSDGSLVKSYDAPDSKIGDITYLNNYLYVVSNVDRKVKKLNPADGSQVTEFSGPGWTDLTSITTDSTDFYIGQKQGKDIYIRGATGTDKGSVADWNSPLDGYQGLAYRSSTQELFSGLDTKIGRFQKSDGKFLQSWTTTISDIKGLAFINEVLYIAEAGTNKVYKASIPTGAGATREPQGIAYDGSKFYIVVDGAPKDKILVVNTDGTLDRNMDAPSDKIDDITYLNDKLYVADNAGTRSIRELNPADGSETNSFSQPWANETFALGNNGTDLLLGLKDNRGILIVRASDGYKKSEYWGDWNDPRMESNGLAYRSSTKEIFAVDADLQKVARLDKDAHYLQSWKVTTLADVRGMVFVGELLYMADVSTQKIYKASIPSGTQVTREPQGIAYDGSKFYIVVDAVPKDKILVVNADGTLDRNMDAPSDKIDDITYLSNKLYVADNAGTRNIRELNPADGSENNSFVSPGYNDVLALGNNGTDLRVGVKDNRVIYVVRASDGYKKSENWGDWNDPRASTHALAYRSTGQEMLAVDATIQKIVRLDKEAHYRQSWKVTALADVRGMVLVGDVLYMADVATQKIYKASMPTGVEVSKVPEGIAYDGTYFYIVVDGTPKDKILVVNADGTLARHMDAPSDKIDDITYLGGSLYVADNLTTGQRQIRQLNPADGTELNTFAAPGGGWDDIAALSNNGTDLLVGKRNSKDIYVVRPSDGFQKNQFWGDGNSPLTGSQGLAYRSSGKELFTSETTKVVRSDETNQFLASWTTTRKDLRGLLFIGDVLYLADADSEAVYKAAIPKPVITVTTAPLGLATDGTYLYIVVDGSPKDKILVANPATGAVVNDYDAPGDGVGAMTYVGGYLYVATYQWNTMQGFQGKIHKVNKNDGTVLDSFNSPNNREISALAPGFTSGKLIAGPKNDNAIYFIDLASPQNFEGKFVAPGSYWGFKAMAQGSLYAVSQENAFVKIDLKGGNPEVTEFRMLAAGQDIRGIAFIGTTLYLADASSQRILASTAPGKRPEVTTAGDYTVKLEVQPPGQALVTSNARSFDLKKITQVTASILQPKQGAAFAQPDITVVAQTNDPSIKTMFLGAEVPFMVVINDNVENPTISNQWLKEGLWQRTDKGKAASGSFAWYYGKVPQLNYETGDRNFGALTSWEFDVSSDTSLGFATWYNTEGGFKSDQKLVQVYGTLNVEGQDVTQWWNLAQIVDFIPAGTQPAPPLNSVPTGFQFVVVPMAIFQFQAGGPQPEFRSVNLSLSEFVGQRVRLRFYFDTVDEQINMLEGWYIDNIFVAGSGSKGKPVQRGTDDKFTTTVTLGDGSNTITVRGANSYTDPSLKGETSVQVSLDRTPPQVWFDPVMSPTSNPSQNVKVFFQEPNWKLFTLEVTNVAGSRIVTSLKEEQAPSGNSITQAVSLMPGVNTIKATLDDKAGLSGSVETSILLDNQSPVASLLSTIYPVGKVSARPGASGRQGDQVIFQMNVTDNASGVKKVVLYTQNAQGQPQETSFMWAGAGNPPGQMDRIPEAVKDQWGATGQFVLPSRIPSSAAPGTYSLRFRVEDGAGNASEGWVGAEVAPVLSAFNFYLMPKWNLVSLPLIPDATLYAPSGSQTQIAKLTANITGLKRIWYYDAAEKEWHIYEPGQPSDLETMDTGKGYWVYMNESAFAMSAPLAPGLPQTPAPIRMSYVGQFLEPATVPPTYNLVAGWNLAGFHGEWAKAVSSYLAGVTYPQRLWAYVLRYDNLIRFEKDQPPEIVLGGFASMTESDSMEPGGGYWVFLAAPGNIGP